MAKENKYENNLLLVIHGNLYSYWQWEEDIKMHKVMEVDIDEEGRLTATYIPAFFSEKEMEEGKEMKLTPKQWLGLTKFLIQDFYFPEEEKYEKEAEKLLKNFFLSSSHLVEELPKFIKTYFEK